MKLLLSFASTLLLFSTCSAAPKFSLRVEDSEDDSDSCECMPLSYCLAGSKSDKGFLIPDFRLSNKRCDNYLEICCSGPNIKFSRKESSAEESSRKESSGEEIIARPYVTQKPSVSTRNTCGVRNFKGAASSSENDEAGFVEFPWMVAITKKKIINEKGKKRQIFQCGGALVHPRVVLTAGHCVKKTDPSSLKVRAGDLNLASKKRLHSHQNLDVQKIAVHENFSVGELANDIGLLILADPVKLGENVSVVCLPESNAVFDYSRCLASGWGKDNANKELGFQSILKSVELLVLSHDTCQNTLRTSLSERSELDQSLICAKAQSDKGVSKGDSGGPLVCPLPNDPDRYVQAGVITDGLGYGDDEVISVYANVASARQWIDRQMADNHVNSNEY